MPWTSANLANIGCAIFYTLNLRDMSTDSWWSPGVFESEGINPLRHLSPGARRAWRNHWSVHDEREEWRTSRLLAQPASLDVIIYDHLWHQGTTNDGDTFSLSKWYTAGQVWPGTVLLHQPGCLGHDTIFQLGHVMKPSLCSESNLPPICLHFVFPSPPSRELWPVDRDLIEASTPCPCSVTVKLHPPSFIPTFEQDPAPSRSRWNMACYYRHSKKKLLCGESGWTISTHTWDIQKIH